MRVAVTRLALPPRNRELQIRKPTGVRGLARCGPIPGEKVADHRHDEQPSAEDLATEKWRGPAPGGARGHCTKQEMLLHINPEKALVVRRLYGPKQASARVTLVIAYGQTTEIADRQIGLSLVPERLICDWRVGIAQGFDDYRHECLAIAADTSHSACVSCELIGLTDTRVKPHTFT